MRNNFKEEKTELEIIAYRFLKFILVVGTVFLANGAFEFFSKIKFVF